MRRSNNILSSHYILLYSGKIPQVQQHRLTYTVKSIQSANCLPHRGIIHTSETNKIITQIFIKLSNFYNAIPML